MNGRLYDPMLMTFLMPDNFVQAPDNTQSYNRYAYALNDPLKYCDRNGESFELVGLVETFANVFTLIGNNQDIDSNIPIDIGCPETLASDSFVLNDDFTIVQSNGQLTLLEPSHRHAERLEIVDIAGKMLLEERSDTNNINVNQLKSGVYILLIYTNENVFVRKFCETGLS